MKLRCNYCGHTGYRSKLFLIRLLLMGKVYVRCSNCGYVSCYRLVCHTVHDTTDEYEKLVNKQLKECERSLFEQC